MKKNALIICEYNPFHNGHFYHINETRAAGAQTVICVMSGNFVQRGDIALCDKSLRAEMAIRCGADLVLELPLPFVLSGARYFALGAAKVAAALNLDATVSFGSQATLKQLYALRDAIDDPATAEAVNALCASSHWSFPRAMQAVIEERMGDAYGALLRDPNSLLALEYLRAFHELSPSCDFFAIRRDAAVLHDADTPKDQFASAMFLRSVFAKQPAAEALSEVASFMPEHAADILYNAAAEHRFPLRKDIFSAIAMTRLNSIDVRQFREVNGVRQGLEYRIAAALKTENDLYGLFDAVKSKRYTHAGIRQSLLSAVFGIDRTDLETELPYLRILGMNSNGRAFLREQKKKCALPLVMNLSEAPFCKLRTLDALAGRITAMCRPQILSGDTEYRVKPFVLQDE